MKRFMIAGTGSNSGKTMITCAILEALKNQNICAFKCGPDYIDPMFHQKVIGVKTCHLDSFFCDQNLLNHLLKAHAGEYNLIEGVMGFYDGAETSSHAISELTDTPVILVMDCKGMSNSIGAVMKGFLSYRQNQIKGFIFNRLPDKLTGLAEQLCEELHTEYFGYFPEQKIKFSSRHLGLITADEISDMQEKLRMLGEQAEKSILIDKLIQLETAVPEHAVLEIKAVSGDSPVIAVSKDEAFCFLYPENMEVLEKYGCTVRYFSLMHDEKLPDADGLILCGGYPELYAEILSENQSMRRSVQEYIQSGKPVIAECGGFLYLHKFLQNKEKQSFRMADIFEGTAFPTARLQQFGYITMTAEKDNLLCRKGETLRAHEFHYWKSTDSGTDFKAVKPDGRFWNCVHAEQNLYAGFPHLYFYGNLNAAENFVKACIEVRKGRNHA